MRDRRRKPRILTFKTGKIVSAPHRAELEAAVLDISDGGACLLVADIADVPATFQLFLDRTSETRDCEVRWKAGYRIGIRFTGLK